MHICEIITAAMKKLLLLNCALASLGFAAISLAQTGPFDPEQWPTTINANLPVHYVVTDGTLDPAGAMWDNTAISILTGGDQGDGRFHHRRTHRQEGHRQ